MFNSVGSRISEFACNLLTPHMLLFNADVCIVGFHERGHCVKTNPRRVTFEVADVQVIPSRPLVSNKDVYCTHTVCVLPVSYQRWFVSLVYVCVLFKELITVCPSGKFLHD